MIAVALLDLEGDLDVGVGAGTWLVSGYLVAMALVQPLGGRIGDAVGHRRTFLVGLTGFLAASALAAAAPTFAVLVALRIAQALAGGLMMPSTGALLRDVVPPERRGALFGWFGTVMGSAAAVGPVLGGVLVDTQGWRAIFLVNLPLAAGALALAAGGLPAQASRSLRGMRFDVAGAAAFTGFVGALVAALFLAPSGPARWAPAAAAGIVCLAAFVAVERRVADPFVSLSLFRVRPYVGATGTILLHNLVLYSLLLIVPVLAERQLGLGASGAGLMVGVLLGALAGAMTIAAPFGGHLSDRLGRRAPALAGAAVASAALIVLTALASDLSVAGAVLLLAVVGAGLGIAGASLQTTAVESVPEDRVAVAGGVFMTVRYTGGIAASGLAAAVIAAAAFRAGFAVLAIAATASLATAWWLAGRPASADAQAGLEPRAGPR
jgi:MFS family permease